jgi:hypothetical protein
VTAIRFQILNTVGEVEVEDCMRSAPAHTSALDDARGIAANFPRGWTVRLWKDVDLFGWLTDKGEPDAVTVSDSDVVDDR